VAAGDPLTKGTLCHGRNGTMVNPALFMTASNWLRKETNCCFSNAETT